MECCASSCLVEYGYGLQADSTTAGGRQGEAVVVAAVLGWVGGGRGCPSGNLQTDVSYDIRAGRDATVCIYS